jgi:hypothetical protein
LHQFYERGLLRRQGLGKWPQAGAYKRAQALGQRSLLHHSRGAT